MANNTMNFGVDLLPTTTNTFSLGSSEKKWIINGVSNPKLSDTTYSAGTGISLSGTTFSNSGVRSISTGTVNGAISVNTNGSTSTIYLHGLEDGYINTHKENGGLIIPFIENDIAFLEKRGGSYQCYVTSDTDYTAETLTSTATINMATLFNGKPNYNAVGRQYTDVVVIDITCPSSMPWTQIFYIDFGATNWRAKKIRVLVKNNNDETTYTLKGTTDNNSSGHYRCAVSHRNGTGFNQIRIVLTDWANQTNTDHRIAQIGVVSYSNQDAAMTLMSRGEDDQIWRSITPATNNTYSLGTSSLKWSNVYAATFTGNLIGDVTGSVSGNATNVTGTVAVEHGGTNATTPAGARTNLGLGSIAVKADTDYIKYNGIDTSQGDSTPAASVKTYWTNNEKIPKNSIVFAYNSSGQEYTTLYSNNNNKYGTILKWGYRDKYLRILRAHPTQGVYSGWYTEDWEKISAGYADSAGSVALSGVSGADDLKAIEALSGTSGFLKKTAANTWTLDTNTYLTSSTGVTSIAGKTGAVTLADLGLSNAMHFLGVTTTNVSTGTANTTATVVIGGSNVTAAAGDVVLYGSQEYVWGNSKWNLLGDESSYKVKQTAKSDPTASTSTSTTFIDTISQDANGVITATKKTLPSYVPTSAGVTAVTWDSTNKKLTRTINGTAADVVTIDTIKTALALTKSDVGLGNVANSTYAGGTAVTLNNSSKASSTASFYAPTTGGTANTQALVGNGATSAPKWVDISPSVTIGAGTGSAAPTVNVTVLGQSGTAKSITTASTSVYGVTKLNDGIGSSSTTLAATANAAYTASRNSLHTLGTTTKFYLTGCSSSTTNTAGDIFDTGIYSTTTAGELSAVRHTLNLNGTDKAYMTWNNTDQSIDFIFK